jgi:branched-chain amino acid transport system substrate-binding protein
MKRFITKSLALAGGLLLAAASHVANAEIKIGISGPLEGPNASTMLELVKGAEIYIGNINQNGGVAGQKISIVARHDNFEVPKTVQVVKKLVEEDNVTALMLIRGTPHNEAILPILAQHKVPLIGPSTGAMVFHKPVNKYVFNVRTAYQLEAEKLVGLLKTAGYHKIAVLHVNDGFGKDLLEGLKNGFIAQNLKPGVILAFDRTLAAKDTTEFMKPVLDDLIKDKPDVIVVVGAGLAVKNAIVAIRGAGSETRIATVSNNASTGFIKLLDSYGPGVIVTQVFPDEKSLTSSFVREAQILAGKNKIVLTPAMMEGFAAAKVLVKGLKDAGNSPSRASLQKALESMGSFDMGDMTITYSPTDHTGLVLTDLSIISKTKGFLR